jgi:hypothetical protein
MNVKAVIYKKSRQPAIHYLTKQEKKEGRFSVDDGTYFITEDDTHHITKRWIGPFKFHYITYYYSELCATPLDFFDLVNTGEYLEEEISSDDASEEESSTEKFEIMKLKLNPPTPQMFNEAFTPAFYKMVRGPTKNTRQDISYYLAWAAALGIAYVAWRVTGIWNIVKDFVPGGA